MFHSGIMREYTYVLRVFQDLYVCNPKKLGKVVVERAERTDAKPEMA